MMRWAVLLLALAHSAGAAEVSVRVLELFRPQRVTLRAPPGGRIAVETEAGRQTLEGAQSTEVTLEDGWAVAADGPVTVSVGGELERTYAGRLTIEAGGGELLLLVQLPLEEAVAAIVAAEAGAQAHPEAQRAQAIATRSFLVASKDRHSGYGFCDTTHCHHFTEANDASQEAARATAGLTLRHGGAALEALSTRRCGGLTRTLAEIGLSSGGGYSYFPAPCEPCRRRPSRWTRTWPAAELAPLVANPGFEGARLAIVRRLGWSAVPSNAYEVHREGDQTRLEGQGEGHGVGLCQFGAAQLAQQGWDAARILRHYFLNAALGKP